MANSRRKLAACAPKGLLRLTSQDNAPFALDGIFSQNLGLIGQVSALQVHNNLLVVGGSFVQYQGAAATNVVIIDPETGARVD